MKKFHLSIRKIRVERCGSLVGLLIVLILIGACSSGMHGIVQHDIDLYKVTAFGNRNTSHDALKTELAKRAALACDGRAYEFVTIGITSPERWQIDETGGTVVIQEMSRMVKCRSKSRYYTEHIQPCDNSSDCAPNNVE